MYKSAYYKFFFVFSFVCAWLCEFFKAAVFCPIISKCVAPSRWQEAEEDLEERIVKDLTQEDELLHLLLEGLGQLLQVVARHQSIAMGKEDAFAVDSDGCWLAVDLCACLLGEPSECPDIVIANEEVDLYSVVCH